MVDDLRSRGPLSFLRVLDMLAVKSLEGSIPEYTLKKRIARIRERLNDSLQNVKRFIFLNIEEHKEENQEWFLFGKNLFSGKDITTCSEEDVNIGLGRGRSDVEAPEFHEDPFLIGKSLSCIN